MKKKALILLTTALILNTPKYFAKPNQQNPSSSFKPDEESPASFNFTNSSFNQVRNNFYVNKKPGFNPSNAPGSITITKAQIGSKNAAIELQTKINNLAGTGSNKGALVIKGTSNGRPTKYVIDRTINLPSNISIYVDPNVVFSAPNNFKNKIVLFTAGKQGNNIAKNISIQCSEDNKKFTVNFSNREDGEQIFERNSDGTIKTKEIQTGAGIKIVNVVKKSGLSSFINLTAVENFKISDVLIKDNYTGTSSITLNIAKKGNRQMFANKGVISNITANKGHYGFGIVQCQAATNVLFENLNGTGGVALRLETGADNVAIANRDDARVRIDNVYGNKITSKNGQAALTMSPHTVKNGRVFINNLTANSCEVGAIFARGFLSQSKRQINSNGEPINGFTVGNFSSGCIIRNLKVKYGTNAQLRGQRKELVPCNQRNLIANNKNPDDESTKGPSIAGYLYSSETAGSGNYIVKLPKFKLAANFPSENKISVTGKVKINQTTTIDDSINCNNTNGSVQNIESNKFINLEFNQKNEMFMKANNFHITTEEGSNINIYNSTGVNKYSIINTNTNPIIIPTHKIGNGIHIIQVQSKTKVTTKKFIF